MSSERIPTTNCVHLFDGELRQLIRRLQNPIGQDGVCCFLYGLWTHTSNVVVHFVVSDEPEKSYAEKHHLDCVGYVAAHYTQESYNNVQLLTKLSPTRQHITVDVNETKRLGTLQAYGRLRDTLPDVSQGTLQVNMLPGDSPFRKERDKQHYPDRTNINGNKNNRDEEHHNNDENVRESETGFGGENEMNGQQYKIDPNSSDIIYLKHKIKNQFKSTVFLEEKESFEKLSLYFKHNDKQWTVELEKDQKSDKTLAEIVYLETEVPSSPKQAYTQEFSAQNVVDRIKDLCGCIECIKQLPHSIYSNSLD